MQYVASKRINTDDSKDLIVLPPSKFMKENYTHKDSSFLLTDKMWALNFRSGNNAASYFE